MNESIASPTHKGELKVALAAILSYIFLRMVGDAFFWRFISEYYSYAFELIFVSLVYAYFRKRIQLWKTPSLIDGTVGLGMLLSGFLTFRFATFFHVPIPFDLTSAETIFLLLVAAPLLEEAIFRMALWESFQVLFKNSPLTLVTTTLLFSAGHFAAYWFVPPEFQGFVIYQSIYVLYLGAIAGIRRNQTGSVSSSLLVHFAFNLGFFFGPNFFN